MILTSVIGLIVVLFAIGGYNASKLQEIKIQKTVTINADIQTVYDNVAYFKNFTKWSPFYEADPSQKTRIAGTDGQVGAQFHWEGNQGKDLGYQEIVQLKALKYLKMECNIQKPFQAKPIFEYTFANNGNSVAVTQDFTLKSGFVDAFFMGIFGAKKDMEKMNGRGMELLKIASKK